MSLALPELDNVTRAYMIREFDAEQSELPYISPVLSSHGRSIWPQVARNAFEDGDDASLAHDLLGAPSAFNAEEPWFKQGVWRTRKVNARQASERLATSEFNTWYVRWLAARLIDEGVDQVVVYRAADPKWEFASCAEHEGRIVSTRAVYDGHRARYWPVENFAAFSIHFQPGCHHSIRRAN